MRSLFEKQATVDVGVNCYRDVFDLPKPAELCRFISSAWI